MPRRPEIKHGLDRAFYSPSGDFVGIPSPGQFKSGEDYYSVLFHELTHATGHESRLNRKGVGGADGEWSAFGSTPYAKEELVAEMGAAFLCGHAGIVGQSTIPQPTCVVLARLKDDRRLSSGCHKREAADFILATARRRNGVGNEPRQSALSRLVVSGWISPILAGMTGGDRAALPTFTDGGK
jgi:antirestriction protein ArdC